MTTTQPYGFTTTILHSDRQKKIEHGSVHKPVHTSVTFGYQDARELAAVFQGKQPGYRYGRQGNPTVVGAGRQDHQDGRRPGHDLFRHRHGGDRRRRPGPAARGRSRGVVGLPVRQYQQPVADRRAPRASSVSLVDATDVAQVEAAITPQTRLVFVETIANPRTQVADLQRIGELCRARGILYVVDNTMTSPYLFRPKTVGAGLVVNALTKSIGGHGIALGGSLTDTGLYDWSAYPNIYDTYKRFAPPQWGIAQIRAKALRDFGAALGPEAAHHIWRSAPKPSPCAWSVPAPARWRWRKCWKPTSAWRRCITRACRRIRSTRWRANCSAPAAACSASSWPRGIDCFDYLNRLQAGDRGQQPGRHAHAGDPGRAHDFPRNGARAARRHGHRRIADPGFGRDRGRSRPAAGFPPGAGWVRVKILPGYIAVLRVKMEVFEYTPIYCEILRNVNAGFHRPYPDPGTCRNTSARRT